MKNISQLMELKGRKALITGAAGHIGGAIAKALAEMGADLILVDKAGSNYASLLSDIAAKFVVNVEIIDCDLEVESERADLINKVRLHNHELSILVNNAAFVGTANLSGWAVKFEDQTLDTWRRAMEVNVAAVFDLCKGLMPLLRVSDGASIVNMGSIYGSLAPDYSLYEGTSMGNPAAGGASKGALIQLTRWLATTVAPEVRVNSVSPGGVFRNQPKVFVDRYIAKTPLRRMAIEEDLLGVIAFLCSDLSSYVTGQDIIVDGGWSVW